MRVLVVEDDRALGVFLQKGLTFEGHEVEWVGDGEAAVESARRWAPDLVVLDLGLPQRDGREVLAVLSEESSRSSILVLTGRGDVEERVRCLNLGADDFFLKPFSFQELTARCRAILRRRERYADPALRERLRDLPALASHLLARLGADAPRKSLSPCALNALEQHPWPGNVRELAHVVERAVILASEAPEITAEHIRCRRRARV